MSKYKFRTSLSRSENMKKIKSTNTKVEKQLRKEIWKLGYRYRLHSKEILGKPDLIFKKYKIVVFVDGEFWHGYNWMEKKKRIKANREYWIPKIEATIERDKKITKELKQQGWKVLRFWDHEIEKDLDRCIQVLIKALQYVNSS